MAFRTGISAAVLLFALGCAGKTSTTIGGDGGVSSSGAGSSGGNAASSGGGSGGGSGSGSGSSSGSSGSSSGATGSDASDMLDAAADVEIPDAFPASCSEATFRLTPDAGAGQCAFTAADVSCNTNADCAPYVAVGCGCFSLVYGVNKTSTARCIPPPCVPLMQDCDASGLFTQDCQFADDSRTLAAACVNHQCLSFSTAPRP